MSPAEPPVPSHPAATARRRALWHWRDWSITAKLLAVILVPVVAIIALAAVQLRTESARAGAYRHSDRIAAAADAVGAVLHDVQDERTAAVGFFAAGSDADPGTLTAHRARLQRDGAALTNRMNEVGALPEGRTGRYDSARGRLGRLPGIRKQVTGHALDAEKAVTSYTSVADALLGLDQALVTSVGDTDLAPSLQALHQVRTAQEYVFYQQAVVLSGISRGSLTTGEAAQVQLSDARLTLALDQFRSTASPGQVAAYQQQLAGAQVDTRNALKQRALTELTAPPGTSTTSPPLTAAQWDQASLHTSDAMTTVLDKLSSTVHAKAADLQHRSTERAWAIAGFALAALLLTLLVALLCARGLRRGLRTLRRSATDIADIQLPTAVARVRSGEQIETTPRTVPVRGRDELGQLARAFESVHGQALRLALDQADLRGNYSDLFVNLSRRSERLVRRQLALIEQMERSEEDPDALATLFQLDHLVTRMRRNNENLMVLSGSDLTRRWNRPIPLADVVRAAVSEIEQYKRVSLQAPAQLAVVGYAASDLARLVAELLDNATTFSAPDTTISVATYDARDGGVSIDILDKGVGMSDEDVEVANAALADPGDVEVSTSRQMGLFVVARLAAKHNVRVRMHGGEEIRGLRVTVTLPSALLTDAPEPVRPAATATAGPIQHAQPVRSAPEVATSPGAFSPGGTSSGASSPGASSPAAGVRAVQAVRSVPPAQAQDRQAQDQPTQHQPTQARQAPVNGTATRPVPAVRSAPPAPAAASPQTASPADDEKTPIFDTMLSVWFRDTKSGGNGPKHRRQPDAEWASEADRGFAAAGRAAVTAPREYTAAGLPKRTPGARILPGSVAASESRPAARTAVNGTARPARHTADPEHGADVVRGRLSSFQRGLQRGRTEVKPAGGAQPDAEPAAPQPSAQPSAPQPSAQPSATPQPAALQPAATGQPVVAVQHAPAPNGVQRTASGLPRRTPGATRIPTTPAAATPARHSAEHLRGQINSFQAGISKGRQSIGTDAADGPSAPAAVPPSGRQEKE